MAFTQIFKQAQGHRENLLLLKIKYEIKIALMTQTVIYWTFVDSYCMYCMYINNPLLDWLLVTAVCVEVIHYSIDFC